MDYSPKVKGKKGLISKTWARCKSYSGGMGLKHSSGILFNKSKSWPRGLNATVDQIPDYIDQEKFSRKIRSKRVAPEGCFSIYVGPEKQRFVIKTVYVNHPLFRMLLEEAESEFGYSSDGPLVLPCDVSHFVKVLMEMDCEEINGGSNNNNGCRFNGAKSYAPISLVNVSFV